jgi:hypothetical protein
MKRCPSCNRNYTDDTLRFCLEDGTPLTQAPLDEPTITTPPAEPPATVVYGAPRPPAPAPYVPQPHATAPVPPAVPTQPAWTPTALPPRPRRKVWPWLLGAFLLLCLLGGGFIVLIIGLASMSSPSNTNSNNSNLSIANSNNSNLGNNNRVVNGNTANANNFGASPKPTPTDVEIDKAYMAKDNGSGEPGEESDTFSPSDHTVHCMITLDHAAEGTQIRFDWIGVDAGEFQNRSIKKLEYTTKALENKVHANVILPRDWPAGEYKVDVYLNEQLARSITYKVE